MQWVAFLALILAALIAYRYVWKPWILPPVKETLEGQATLYMFYTDWCGFSKKAQPEWAQMSDGTYGTTKVKFVKVDCEKSQSMCSDYGIEGYPTVKLETSEGIQDFGKQVTSANLEAFLKETLGQKA
jgi:thioredoxin-like negative regulator of GroEL